MIYERVEFNIIVSYCKVTLLIIGELSSFVETECEVIGDNSDKLHSTDINTINANYLQCINCYELFYEIRDKLEENYL